MAPIKASLTAFQMLYLSAFVILTKNLLKFDGVPVTFLFNLMQAQSLCCAAVSEGGMSP